MMNEFSQISKIKIEKPITWENKLFLTFDTDWACEELIDDTLSIVEKYDVPTTWFVTGRYKALENSDQIEIGLHPNFNPLLDWKQEMHNDLNTKSILENLMSIYPNATSLRSHSLVQSERLIDLFAENEISHICNSYIPTSSKILTRPFSLWDGLTMVPHCYQDNAAIKMSEELFYPQFQTNQSHMFVFDFHPIHIYLNTESLARYENTRQFHKEPKRLLEYRYTGSKKGVRDHLINLLNICSGK